MVVRRQASDLLVMLYERGRVVKGDVFRDLT